MELFNTLSAASAADGTSAASREIVTQTVKTMLVLLYPMVPHFSSELWQIMDFATSPEEQSWPEFDEEKAKEEQLTIVIQVNGKVRSLLEVAADIADDVLQEEALADEKVLRFIDGKTVKKVIVVKKKLVNIVV